jgi:hypothetical protein
MRDQTVLASQTDTVGPRVPPWWSQLDEAIIVHVPFFTGWTLRRCKTTLVSSAPPLLR